jgi:V8-like Glu-specific endopeptidase
VAVTLSHPDFRELTRIVQNLPEFGTERDRRRLVAGALEGSPRATDILSQLDLGGAPRGVAVEIIRRLSNFGRVTADKEALGIFLNYLLFFKGEEDEDATFIRELFETYQLDRPIISGRVIDEWRGTETSTSVQEKVIGEDTLRHIRILELALEAAKAVVHISVPGGAGTGFMIASDLLMTNNHVISSKQTAAASAFAFDYELDREGKQKQTMVGLAHSDGIFYTSERLDYSVVQLSDPPSFGEALVLKSMIIQPDERVSIIQHPGGHYKKISMQNNFVAYADNHVVQYTTSTMPGSSGSPVFNGDFDVIAIHHSGGMLEEPGTGRRYLRNAGTSTVAILADLKMHAPEIHSRLGG